MTVKHIKPKQPIRIVSEEEKLFRNIFRYSNDAIFIIDPNIDKILDVNPKACAMLGYSYEELLSSPISAIHSQEISKFLGFTDSVMRSGHGRTSELTFLCKTGHTIKSEISASPMVIDDHQCIVAMVSDISERKKTEEKLKIAENRIDFEKTKLEEVLSIEEGLNGIFNLDELIDFIVDKATKILEAEKCSVMFISENAEELCIRGFRGLNKQVIEKNRIRLGDSIAGQIALEGKPVLVSDIETDKRFLRKNRPSYKSKSFISAPLKSEDHLLGVINVTDKVSNGAFCEIDLKILNMIVRQVAVAIENNKLFRELKHLTTIDPLTNIYNYRHFLERLDHECNRLKRYSGSLSLLMIDVDDFKSYNDTYGHLEGDMLLKKISNVLTKTLRNVDIVCRYAGDEFVVILPECKISDAEIVAEKIRKNVEDLSLKRKVTLSIGVGRYAPNMSCRDLILQADQALLKGKREGKNRVLIS